MQAGPRSATQMLWLSVVPLSKPRRSTSSHALLSWSVTLDLAFAKSSVGPKGIAPFTLGFCGVVYSSPAFLLPELDVSEWKVDKIGAEVLILLKMTL